MKKIRFDRIQVSRKDLRKLLPSGFQGEIGRSRTIIYGAITDEGTVGWALFSIPNEVPGASLRLHYVSINSAYRGQGLAKALLEYAFGALKGAEASFVIARAVSEDAEDLLRFSELAESFGFVPVGAGEILYIYDRKRVRSCPFVKEVMENKNLPPVTAFEDKEDPILLSFNSKGEFGLLAISEDIADLAACRFYVEENKIVSGVLAKSLDENILSLRKFTTDTGYQTTKRILPQLLVHSMEAGLRNKEIKRICLVLSDDLDAAFTEKTFGPPDMVYRAVDHIKYL